MKFINESEFPPKSDFAFSNIAYAIGAARHLLQILALFSFATITKSKAPIMKKTADTIKMSQSSPRQPEGLAKEQELDFVVVAVTCSVAKPLILLKTRFGLPLEDTTIVPLFP